MTKREQEIKVPDLLESTYPLLVEFRKKCAGTYKHSQALMSIIEAVAMDLDLDINSMKIMAMFHDVGKMLNPIYFSENQGDENLHDDLDPYMSTQIITHHVSDSISILINDENFPRNIIESISRHHGTSLLKMFWKKNKNNNLKEEDFRYRTSKPKTIEDAILMIVDCAEASTRSLNQSGKLENISEHVENIVNDLLNDGQLDDVVIRLGDLKKIKNTLKNELGGLFQKRVDYIDDEKSKEEN